MVTVLPFVVMLAFAIHEFIVHAGSWPAHAATHSSWLSCLWHIAVLALPAFAVLTVAVRRLAPVRLRHAGFYIGLAAGGIGAMALGVACLMGYCYVLDMRSVHLAVLAVLTTSGPLVARVFAGVVRRRQRRLRLSHSQSRAKLDDG